MVTNTVTAQFCVNPLKMEAQIKNSDVSEPPLTEFAQHSNYITYVLLSVGTATDRH